MYVHKYLQMWNTKEQKDRKLHIIILFPKNPTCISKIIDRRGIKMCPHVTIHTLKVNPYITNVAIIKKCSNKLVREQFTIRYQFIYCYKSRVTTVYLII